MLNATTARVAVRSPVSAFTARAACPGPMSSMRRSAVPGERLHGVPLAERAACPSGQRGMASLRGFSHWRSREDQQLGLDELIDGGVQARQSLRAGAPRLESWRSGRRAQADEQLLQAVAAQPHLRAGLIASSLRAGLDHDLPSVLLNQAVGVRDGLRFLKLAPGDRVAEIDPMDFSLPAALARRGCEVTLIHSDPATSEIASREISALRQGRVRGWPAEDPEGKPRQASACEPQDARRAGACLAVKDGDAFDALQGAGAWRALISRGTMGFREPQEVIRLLQQAAYLLAPGGGLVFQLAHEAGEADRFGAGWTRCRLSMEELETPARRAGLILKLAQVTFASPGVESGQLLPLRTVTPECHGKVDFANVDAAAWNAWEHLSRDRLVRDQPMTVEVSGLLVREPRS